MVQFKPYFLAEAPPPAPRATTVQPCVRTVDIDVTGTSARHVTFLRDARELQFRRLLQGPGDRLRVGAAHRELGLDPEHLWVTVHVSDDEAEALWRDILACSRDDCSDSTRTTSGRWARRAHAAHVLRSISTGGPSTGPVAGPPKGASATSSSGTSCSSSTTVTPTARSRSFPSGTSTPEPARPDPHADPRRRVGLRHRSHRTDP